MKSYEEQVHEQIEQYRETENMHELPAVFHRWSHNHIGPGLREVFGVATMNDFYVEAFMAAISRRTGVPAFLSLGCGDGSVEIGIGSSLRARGIENFRFICYDLSDHLLERFRAALPAELTGNFELVAGDLNSFAFDRKFDAIMANHSLHHMVDLEGIFQTVYNQLANDGVFVTNDMIGRNGHLRWPETRLFVDFFWPFITRRQRRNIALSREETQFIDHDCATVGFEGVRSQDILALILRQGFTAEKFMSVGGLIDVFIDRGFGHNFDPGDPDDGFLIDRVGMLNDLLLDAGLIKPTMMFGYFVKHSVEMTYYRNRTAERAVRDPDVDPAWLADAVADLGRDAPPPGFVYKAPAFVETTPPVQPAGVLEATVAALRQAQRDVAEARAEAERQALLLRAMEASSSWQLTAPLRVLARKMRERRPPG